MDKKIFLFDKEVYNEGTIKTLTEKECEEWVADSDYEGDILSAFQDYVDCIKALDAKQHTSADGWKFARKGKKK